MKGIIKWCIPGLFLLCGTAAQGQIMSMQRRVDSLRALQAREPISKPAPLKKPKPIRTEFSGGVRLNTDGWSVFFDKGWVKSTDKKRDYFYDTRIVQFEFSEKKHLSEIKSTNVDRIDRSNDQKPKSFVYSKVNNTYTMKLGYGNRKMIAGKPEHGTVSIHWVYAGGIGAALQKPYYLEAYVPIPGIPPGPQGEIYVERKSIKYSDSTANSFLNPNLIVGSSGFGKGLDEIKIIPGVHFKTALHFDFGNSKTQKLALETGVNAEYYSKKLEMMVTADPKPYFVNFYVSVQFGKRRQ